MPKHSSSVRQALRRTAAGLSFYRLQQSGLPDEEHKGVAVELPLPPERLHWRCLLLQVITKLHMLVISAMCLHLRMQTFGLVFTVSPC